MIFISRMNMKMFFTTLALLISLCDVTPALANAATVFILTSSEWNVPRTTETILTMPALQQTIQAYNQQPKSLIQIQYPGGDEGTLWASELRSWLIALGIGSDHIELLPGSRKAGQLELQVIPVQMDSALKTDKGSLH